jgi:hypothetical protein
VLHDHGRPGCGVARVEPGTAASGALVEEVVGAVELDLDRLEPLMLLGGDPVSVAGVLPEALFLLREVVDPVEHVVVEHGRASW